MGTTGRKPCIFDECERPRASKVGYCSAHLKQWRKHGRVWVFGDREEWRAVRAAAWAAMPAEKKAARVAAISGANKGRVRSSEHSRRISESLKARWAGPGFDFPDRQCRGCDKTFTPNSNHHWYCDEECQRARTRLRVYGMTNREYLNMLEAQGGVCALCKEDSGGFVQGRYGLVIDHCHDSGKVRGLLCGNCNTAIGRFGDNPERLRAAADYIEGV